MTEQTNEDFSRALARSMVEQRVDNGRVYENMMRASKAFSREIEISRVRRIMYPEKLLEMVKKDRKKYNLKKVLSLGYKAERPLFLGLSALKWTRVRLNSTFPGFTATNTPDGVFFLKISTVSLQSPAAFIMAS